MSCKSRNQKLNNNNICVIVYNSVKIFCIYKNIPKIVQESLISAFFYAILQLSMFWTYLKGHRSGVDLIVCGYSFRRDKNEQCSVT